MSKNEQVLCVEREHLPAAWLGRETALVLTSQVFFETMKAISVAYRERRWVEQDRTWKQLIPYLVVQSQDGGQTACYRRHGSELRLHDRMSVGVGGHVILADALGGKATLADTLSNGIRRELREEFKVLDGAAEAEFVGIINEEITAVGEVHTGLVYRLTVDHPAAVEAGPELANFQWLETSRVLSLSLELWSRLALRLVDGLCAARG